MDLVTVVICGLAGWRIASLFLFEEGPFSVFEKIRRLVGVKPGPIEGFLPTLFTCIYCFSLWAALGAYLIWLVEPMIIIPIAVASTVLIVDKLVRE